MKEGRREAHSFPFGVSRTGIDSAIPMFVSMMPYWFRSFSYIFCFPFTNDYTHRRRRLIVGRNNCRGHVPACHRSSSEGRKRSRRICDEFVARIIKITRSLGFHRLHKKWQIMSYTQPLWGQKIHPNKANHGPVASRNRLVHTTFRISRLTRWSEPSSVSLP